MCHDGYNVPIYVSLFARLIVLFTNDQSKSAIARPIMFMRHYVRIYHRIIIMVNHGHRIRSFNRGVLLTVFCQEGSKVTVAVFLTRCSFLMRSILCFFMRVQMNCVGRRPINPTFPNGSSFSSSHFIIRYVVRSFCALCIAFVTSEHVIFIIRLFRPIVSVMVVI